jgi:hypothetical protein
MKKIIAFGIVAALAACGGSKKGSTTTPDNKGSGSMGSGSMGGQGYGGSAAPAPTPTSGGTGY